MTEPAESKLLHLLRERKAAENGGDVDWPKVRDEWVAAVGALLDRIAAWLKPAEGQGLAKVHREQLQISEESLGTYTIEQLWAELPGRDVLIVRPVARVIIGGAGRVDLLVGPRSAMLVQGKAGDWSLARRTPRLQMLPLTNDLFEEVLEDLLRGE